ncbi:MAG: sigma-70 family RNA polymerase sigma factor [Acidimicrobiales bacterium]
MGGTTAAIEQAMNRTAGQSAAGVIDRSFGVFYAEAYPGLVRLGLVLTGSVGDAEDLAQETLSRALTLWARVSTLESPLGWCRHVCLNLVYSRTRRLRREAAALLRLGSLRPVADDAIAVSDAASEFWAAVRSLPPRQAQVVALRYAADLQAVEIAATLGRDPATVRSHLHAARSALAARLEADLDEEDPS